MVREVQGVRAPIQSTLTFSENKIASLGALPQTLQSLVADDNKLSCIALEGHPSLTILTANSNHLTSCRVGNNPKLKVRNCAFPDFEMALSESQVSGKREIFTVQRRN